MSSHGFTMPLPSPDEMAAQRRRHIDAVLRQAQEKRLAEEPNMREAVLILLVEIGSRTYPSADAEAVRSRAEAVMIAAADLTPNATTASWMIARMVSSPSP